MVVEVIDAPWAGVPARIRWHKRRWICRETTCQIATFIEQNHSVCTPRARLGPGRSAGRSDSCASKEPPSLAWPDNWQPRGTPCGPTSSRAYKPHLMTPPASQACRYWELTSTYGITRTDAAGAT